MEFSISTYSTCEVPVYLWDMDIAKFFKIGCTSFSIFAFVYEVQFLIKIEECNE